MKKNVGFEITWLIMNLINMMENIILLSNEINKQCTTNKSSDWLQSQVPQ